jgi:hypothetical protein
VWWVKLVIPAPGRLRQEFEASLSYIARLSLKNKTIRITKRVIFKPVASNMPALTH